MTENNRLTYSPGGIIFLVASLILFSGAIGILIWLLVDAAEEHLVNNVLFGSALLVITIGVLIYALFVYKAPKTSKSILWVSIILGVISYIIGLCIGEPTSKSGVDIDKNFVPRTEINHVK